MRPRFQISFHGFVRQDMAVGRGSVSAQQNGQSMRTGGGDFDLPRSYGISIQQHGFQVHCAAQEWIDTHGVCSGSNVWESEISVRSQFHLLKLTVIVLLNTEVGFVLRRAGCDGSNALQFYLSR